MKYVDMENKHAEIYVLDPPQVWIHWKSCISFVDFVDLSRKILEFLKNFAGPWLVGKLELPKR